MWWGIVEIVMWSGVCWWIMRGVVIWIVECEVRWRVVERCGEMRDLTRIVVRSCETCYEVIDCA